MNKMISRPARGVLPLALTGCILFRPFFTDKALLLMAALLLARICSLCAGAAFRIASGSVVNTARLRGNLLTAFIMALVGGAVSVVLCSVGIPYLSVISLPFALAGALINIAQLCSDRLYAAYDSFSPHVFDIIIAAFAAAGLLISEGSLWALPLTTAVTVIAGIMLLFGLRGGSRVKTGLNVLRSVPFAFLSDGLLPCLIVFFALCTGGAEDCIAITFTAVALLEICASPFLRGESERSPLTVFVALWAVATSLCVLFIPKLPLDYMCCLLFACIGVILTGMRIDLRRVFILTAMIAAGFFTVYPLDMIGFYAMIACCIALIGLIIPDILAIHRTLRANRIKKRRRAA